jgi:phage shock protein A
MPDSLQDRVARLISGTAHALMDKVEGLAPEATMAQAIREIEQVVAEVRGELGRIEASKHQLTVRLARLAGEHEELAGKAELAVQEQRDDLAAACLEKQTLIEDQLPVLEQALATQRERAVECESYLRALLARKQERETLLHEFLAARRRTVEAAGDAPASAHARTDKVERAESAFDRVMARETGVLGLAGVPGDAMKLKEMDDLQRRKRIGERLALLKQQFGKPSS